MARSRQKCWCGRSWIGKRPPPWNRQLRRNGFRGKATAAMGILRQTPANGSGMADPRDSPGPPLETIVDSVTGARADAPCEDGANARDGCRGRWLTTAVGGIATRMPKPRAGTRFPGAWSSATAGSTGPWPPPWRGCARAACRPGRWASRSRRPTGPARCAGASTRRSPPWGPAPSEGSASRACPSTPRT